MPAQSFRKFSKSERRAWINPELAASPILARLGVFGGALALTAYGAYQMYKVVGVGTHDRARMGDGRPVRRHILLDVALLHRERRRLRLADRATAGSAIPCPPSLDERTAVVMPIYNEAPSRVFGAMQAIIEDVERTGLGDAFDYFFLSDTTDGNVWVAEERAFLAMRERLPGRADLLPAAAQEHEPQGRQHRRLRHPLGRPLRAHARARRRQRHVRRRGGAACRGDGGRSGQRDHPEPAADHQPQHDVRAAAAVRRADRRPGPRRRPHRLDGPRRQLLGPQRDHPHARLRRSLRACPTCPAGRRSAAISSATTSSRRRSSGAPAIRSTCCRRSAAPTRRARRR